MTTPGRGDDVLLLAEHFLEHFSREYAAARPTLTVAIRAEMLLYPWPGNVREPRNSLERAIILGDAGLRQEDLYLSDVNPATDCHLRFPAPSEAIQRAAAQAMVASHRGNQSAAAAALGVSR